MDIGLRFRVQLFFTKGHSPTDKKPNKMNKISFLSFCIGFVILLLFYFGMSPSFNLQIGVSILLISMVGIPHGAIDHVLFLEKSRKISTFQFYAFYFGLMAIYVVAWLQLTFWSLVFFLVLSAYHFGQSQFSDLKINSRITAALLHLVWGTSLLSGLVFYNHQEIYITMTSDSSLPALAQVFNTDAFEYIYYLSLAGTVISFILLKVTKKISNKRLAYEILSWGLILLAFVCLPPIIGFTLYFISLHSMKVMEEEFNFLRSVRTNFSISKFIQLLLPYSLIGFLGTWGMVAFAQLGWIGGNGSDILLVLILLSILTLPHSIVMDRFYQQVYAKA